MSASELNLPEWLTDLKETSQNVAFYESGRDFSIQFTKRSAGILFVGFDDLSKVRSKTRLRDGWGYSFARKEGWSYLGISTFSENWFRDSDIHCALESLASRGFFRKFGNVVLSGTSMGGYGACAFAPLSPGCTVVAFSPQSTLSPYLAGWDTRYPQGTAQNWSEPFADAATGVRSACRAWVIYDPKHSLDHRHALRISGPNVTHLRARYTGHNTAQFLRQIGVLSEVSKGCALGAMTESVFYSLFRRGRNYRRLQQALVKHVIARGGVGLQKHLAEVLKHRKRPGLARIVETALGRLENAAKAGCNN